MAIGQNKRRLDALEDRMEALEEQVELMDEALAEEVYGDA